MTDSHQITCWRHIVDVDSPGPYNMAVDEALLNLFEPGRSTPVFRVYGWYPPALSIGRFQDAADLDQARVMADGVDVVRRISGGGTIYHADELTYSIVCSPEQIPATDSVKHSFRILTGFLIEFYSTLGLDAQYAVDAVPDPGQLGVRTPFCFAGKETFDVMINNRKIGGNAQRRRRGVIFQHGSIPLFNRAGNGLAYMKDCRPEYAENTVSLRECGITCDVPRLRNQLASAFSRHMGVLLERSRLSADEQLAVDELLTGKYTSDHWNLQGKPS